ncbi:DUF1499 domain-containing protein [Candidatus Palauibacter sp.]|uniref:DUF1499 domain-containing protein n=1 Tax=Candidatus Palauibacter sp. TaxID=3101350 RepID=UPI003AF29E50
MTEGRAESTGAGEVSGTSADTRRPDGPEPRLYQAPFACVWDELLRYVRRRPSWKLVLSDEDLGLISVRCVNPVLRFVDDLTVWVALDGNGLTRVDALSRARRRDFDLGANRRRIRRMLLWLDRALGPAARLSESAGTAEPGPPSEALPGAS